MTPETKPARLACADDGCLICSACGRFTIRVTWRGNATYRLLTDAVTGREYPCRTVDSAKTVARNLAKRP